MPQNVKSERFAPVWGNTDQKDLKVFSGVYKSRSPITTFENTRVIWHTLASTVICSMQLGSREDRETSTLSGLLCKEAHYRYIVLKSSYVKISSPQEKQIFACCEWSREAIRTICSEKHLLLNKIFFGSGFHGDHKQRSLRHISWIRWEKFMFKMKTRTDKVYWLDTQVNSSRLRGSTTFLTRWS